MTYTRCRSHLSSSRLIVHHTIVGFEEEEMMARLEFDSTHPHVGFRCSHCFVVGSAIATLFRAPMTE